MSSIAIAVSPCEKTRRRGATTGFVLVSAQLHGHREEEAEKVEALIIEQGDVLDRFHAHRIGSALRRTGRTPRVGGLEVGPQRPGLLRPVLDMRRASQAPPARGQNFYLWGELWLYGATVTVIYVL